MIERERLWVELLALADAENDLAALAVQVHWVPRHSLPVGEDALWEGLAAGGSAEGTVETEGFASESDFLKAATDPDLVHAKGIDAQTFEGYLFPDTYYFPRGVTHENIISTMVRRFRSVYKPEWEEQTKTLGLTIHQVITLASIIEKETD